MPGGRVVYWLCDFLECITTGDILQNGRGLLHLASENGHKEVVELLLDEDADVDKEDNVML